MNHSIHSADRSTHLKIVVVALVAGIVVAGLGIGPDQYRLRPSRSCHQGRQADDGDELGRDDGPLRNFLSRVAAKRPPPGRPFCF